MDVNRKGCEKIGEIENQELFICEKKKERKPWIIYDNLLKSWKKHLEEDTIKVFETSGRQEGYSKEDLQKIIDEGLLKFEQEIQEENWDYVYSLFETSFKEFLEDKDIKIEDMDVEKIDEYRFLFEEKLKWNYEDLFNFDVILLDKKMYEIQLISSVDGVMKTKDYKEFRQKSLQYLTEQQFNKVLLYGDGYFAIIINASQIIEALKKGEKSVSNNDVLVGVHNWMEGSGGYFERSSSKNYSINLDNAELDISNYGIEGMFGRFF